MVEGDSHGLLRHLLRLAAQAEALDCLLPTNKKAQLSPRPKVSETGERSPLRKPLLGTGFHRQIRKKLQQLPIKRQQLAIQLPCQYDEFGVVRGAARRDG